MRTLLALAAAMPGVALAAGGDKQDYDQIARGRYLTILGDCEACHTPPGGAAFSGGRPLETPFGTILSSNITPDAGTGIGTWTDDEFVRVLQQGVDRNGNTLYPAMPYTYTARVTRGDALAIRAYLATLPPARHAVVENQLPFPFNIRAVMKVWNALFFTPGEYRYDTAKSAEWNRGAYLVTGLDHCGMCHTPKNVLGGDKTSERHQGYALQGWFAPNITNDVRRGIGGWSVEDVVAYLRTGHNRFASASGPMAEEVYRSGQWTSDEDLRAMAVYLKDQPGAPRDATPAVAANDPQMRAGAAIYGDRCSACHGGKGEGIAYMIPALAGGPAIQSPDPASTIRVILRGVRSVSTRGAPTGPGMPSLGWQLNDAQVAAVATFVRNAWGNSAPAVSADRVASTRAALAGRKDDGS